MTVPSGVALLAELEGMSRRLGNAGEKPISYKIAAGNLGIAAQNAIHTCAMNGFTDMSRIQEVFASYGLVICQRNE